MSKTNAKTINYTASPTAARFLQSRATVKGIKGPMGSGKSSVCCIDIGRMASLVPPNREGVRRSKCVAIRNTYRELMDTTLATWLEWFPENPFGVFNKNEMTHYVRFTRPDDGTVVELDVVFRALDRPDDLKKLKGMEFTFAWLNEAVELAHDVLAICQLRIGRFPPKKDYDEGSPLPKPCIIMDTNPPDTDHWWYKLAEETVPMFKALALKKWASWNDALAEVSRLSGGVIEYEWLSEDEAQKKFEMLMGMYEFFNQPSGMSRNAENIENLDEGYYDRLIIGNSPAWIKVMVHGEYGFISDGQPVYPEYSDERHYFPRLLEPDPQLKTIVRGWDGGRTPACVFAQVLPDGSLQVFDELTADNMSVAEFADIVIAHCAANYDGFKFKDIGDPSMLYKGQYDTVDPRIILGTKGIELEGGIQMPGIRQESIKKLLRESNGNMPRFRIGPKCTKVRKGLMGGYQYKRKQVSGGARYHDKPDKDSPFSHPIDALEYIGTMFYGKSVLEPDFDYEESFEDSRFVVHEGGRSAVTGY